MSVLKNITSVYKSYARYPNLNSAKFLNNADPYIISSTWTVNDLVTSKTKNLNLNFYYEKDKNLILKSPQVLMDEEIIMDVYSSSYKHRAIFLERKSNDSSGKESKTNLIHLWIDELFIKSINLNDMDIHGMVHKKSFNFGNFQWLKDGRKLVYIAESKKPKKLSFFQNVSHDQSAKGIEIGNQFKYKQDFGEQLTNVGNPVICILDVDEEQIEVLDSTTLCPGLSIGTVCCHPNGLGLVFTGYENMPYNLGLIYCIQRHCELFYYSLDSKEIKKIGDENKSQMSPKFSPDGRFIIWLETDASGPHMQCQRLMKYEIATGFTDVVVDVVKEPITEFTGLYNLGLTENCWTYDSNHILLTSAVKCQNKIILIDIKTKNVNILNVSETVNSETLLDLNDRFLLVKVSSPSTVPYLAIGELKSALLENEMRLVPLSSIYRFDNVLNCQILDHIPEFDHPKFGKKKYQSIFISSKKEGSCPMILMLHGGPHSAFYTDFTVFGAAVAELGFHALMVNYRDSWGYGQDSIDSLLGYIGQMDVKDCIKASEDMIREMPSKVDGNKIFLYGGSHGGFLASHLAAHYSDRVKSAACRNPVINLISMTTTTDIPDWNFTECGIKWKFDYLLNKEDINTMWERSPLSLVDKIKCPILIMIGQDDKRVPPSQGLELYKALRARSVKTELYIYPKDCHPLASVEASSDSFVNVLWWFTERYLDE